MVPEWLNFRGDRQVSTAAQRTCSNFFRQIYTYKQNDCRLKCHVTIHERKTIDDQSVDK